MSQIRYLKRTILDPHSRNTKFQCAGEGPITDLAVQNVGTSDFKFRLNGSSWEIMPAGSPMLSLGSYDGAICDDILEIDFGTPVPVGARAWIFANKIIALVTIPIDNICK
jgi:hypothetical protein